MVEKKEISKEEIEKETNNYLEAEIKYIES